MTDLADRRRSTCRLCGGYCGILVDVANDRVVRVSGDVEHPDSQGYTCAKGRSLPAFLNSARRLDHPLLHGQRVSWSVILDDPAQHLEALDGARWAHAVGTYGGTAEITDRAGMWERNRFARLLGTHQRYSSATVDIAPMWKASELVCGSARDTNPVWESETDNSPRFASSSARTPW